MDSGFHIIQNYNFCNIPDISNSTILRYNSNECDTDITDGHRKFIRDVGFFRAYPGIPRFG